MYLYLYLYLYLHLYLYLYLHLHLYLYCIVWDWAVAFVGSFKYVQNVPGSQVSFWSKCASVCKALCLKVVDLYCTTLDCCPYKKPAVAHWTRQSLWDAR